MDQLSIVFNVKWVGGGEVAEQKHHMLAKVKGVLVRIVHT